MTITKYSPEIATQIFRFFSVENKDNKEFEGIQFPRSLNDFIKFSGINNLVILHKIIQKLINEGYMIELMQNNSNQVTGKFFLSVEYQKRVVEYGGMNCLVNGWHFTKKLIENSIFHLVHTHHDLSLESGTAFIIEGGYILTANHCVKGAKKVSIHAPNEIAVKGYWHYKDDRYDIALLKIDKKINLKELGLANYRLLENIMSVGFPPISGLNPFQVCSTGELISFEEAYLDGQPNLVINARLKGGNSGGPIMNKLGFVIGLLIRIPNDPQNQDEYDQLGFGLALPVEIINEFLQLVNNESDEVEYVEIKENEV